MRIDTGANLTEFRSTGIEGTHKRPAVVVGRTKTTSGNAEIREPNLTGLFFAEFIFTSRALASPRKLGTAPNPRGSRLSDLESSSC